MRRTSLPHRQVCLYNGLWWKRGGGGKEENSFFISFSFLAPLDNGGELIRDGWPSPPEGIDESSDFRDQVQEYIRCLDDIRDGAIAANGHGAIARWLNNLAGFRGIFTRALNNVDSLAVDFQVATQYLNNIHRLIELF